MIIKRKSVISGVIRRKEVPVKKEDYESWEKGFGSITECMPYLNVDDRSYILAGITNSERKDMFKEITDIINDKF